MCKKYFLLLQKIHVVIIKINSERCRKEHSYLQYKMYHTATRTILVNSS